MVLAETDTEIWVAVITALGAFLTVGIPAYLKASRVDRRSQETEKRTRDLQSVIGEKNGHGDAMTMLATSLQNQVSLMGWNHLHEESDNLRFQALDTSLKELADRMTVVEGKEDGAAS